MSLVDCERPATVEEAAKFLGTKESVLRTWLSTKRFPELNRMRIKLGSSIRFDWADLDAFKQSLKGRN
jgi:excisionase family DNA binding protein